MTYRKNMAPTGAVLTDPQQRINQVVGWVDKELTGVENELRLPRVRGMQFEILGAEPERFGEGDLYYFGPGVVGGGAGLYIRDAGNWRRL